LDDDFGIVPLIFEASAALRTLEVFYYIKYENTTDKRNALLLLETLVDTKYSTKQRSIKDYFQNLN